MKMKSNFVAGLVLLFLVLTLAGDVKAQYNSWNNYHWARTSNPFTLQLDSNVSNKWESFLWKAANDWSISSVLDTIVVDGGKRSKECEMPSGRIEVCNSKYGETGWFGLTNITLDGEHITGATVKLNDSYMKKVDDSYKQMIMCHEIGHALGLWHQDEAFRNEPLGTCLDFTTEHDDSSSFNMQPNQQDYATLDFIYNHLDSFNTFATEMPEQPTSVGGKKTLKEWGKLIHVSNQGKELLFERDLGRGKKSLTIVSTVPDDDPLADEDK